MRADFRPVRPIAGGAKGTLMSATFQPESDAGSCLRQRLELSLHMTERGFALPPEQAFPLTQRQSLFWIDRKLSPAVPIHNTLLSVELRGLLDADRLEAAYREAVSRLDFLRLFVDDAEPRQWVVDLPARPIEHVDLSAHPGTFAAWKGERSARLFAFPGWLHDVALVRLGPTEHVLCVLLHHICADGTSAIRLVDYLAQLYAGQTPAARPGFRDYTAAEAAYQGSPKHARDARYWQPKLRGGAPTLRFYGKVRTSRSAEVVRVWHDYGEAKRARLGSLLENETFQLLSPAMSRLAVISTLLFAFVNRVTENRELVLATPMENRGAPFHDTFGLLMEEAFLKVEIDDEETFSSLYQKVRSDLLRTFRHAQHCVSERGLDFVSINLLTPRVASFADLACHVRLEGAVVLGGLAPEAEAGLKNSLGVQIHDMEASSGLVLGFDFHAQTFPADQRLRVVEHMQRILDAFLADPSQRIDCVELVAAAEREGILAAGAGRTAGRPIDVVDQLATQAVRSASKLSVVASGQALNYEALFARVYRFAHRLRQLGVVAEARIAVSLPRGLDELTCLLGILTAGAAYVPLDPAQPLERLRMIVEDAQPDLLVTRRGMPLANESVRLLFLEEEAPQLEQLPDTRPAVGSAPDALAYILFTSGSTGRPKGVEISRGALSNFLSSMAHTPGLQETDRLLAITTTMFDIAGLELFLPLYVGATLQIADTEAALDARRLRGILDGESISVMQATPATWRALIETGWTGHKGLRMLVGGEALSRELASALLNRGSELWNMYGPTETTVWSTLARVEREGEIVIGRPIDNTQIYVLDRLGQPLPVGVAGELCIGGDGLARGYFRRPDLNEGRFVQSPLGSSGERLYRTGDLARLLESGQFECLGRLDHQVKIRGFRVELGEIEARLSELPMVRQAVVVVRPGREAEPRLVAYVRPEDGAQLTTAELTQALRSKLPSYMLPSQYVCLPEFPLTSNGKIDRKQLPAPELLATTEVRERLAPRTPTEATLAEIWAEVLRTSDLGIDDDFFELGGHSLLAVKIFDRVHRQWAVELPLAALFESPTIESLARRIDNLVRSPSQGETWTTVVPIQPRGSRPPLFCVSGMGGNPMNFAHLAAALGREQPFYGLQHRGVDGRLPPHTSVRAMAEEFVADLRKVQPHGPYYLSGYSAGGLAAYEMARILEASGDVVGLLIFFDTFCSTTPRWSLAERLEAHWDKLRSAGVGYISNRVGDRVSRSLRDYRRRLRARLAHREPFRFRLDALVEAGMLAERSFRPEPYAGRVLLLQADARLTAGDGIGYKPHESNGWRQHLQGRFDVVQLACSHTDVMGENAAPLAAAEIRRALAEAQQSQKPAHAEAPPLSTRALSVQGGAPAPGGEFA